MRTLGTVVRGVRAPIVKQGDDLISIVTRAITDSANIEGYQLHDKDVVAVTESVLARAQGNFATVEQIASDVRAKFPGGIAGVTLPILSRNRFQNLLKGIALGLDKLYIQLAYPADEVGNHLITLDQIDEAGVNPYTDVLSESDFHTKFGDVVHFFTGIDYIKLYKEIAPNSEIILANDPRAMLQFTKHVITCDVHSRFRSKRLLKEAGATTVLGLDDLLTASVEGSGYNPDYGLLGSNKATNQSTHHYSR